MPFSGTFVDVLDGHLIYGWGTHREFFRQNYGKLANKPRYMEDFGSPDVKSSSDFGAALKAGHDKYKVVVDKGGGPSWTDKDSAQKCKGGLWWATRNSKHVHFYLGGLDIDMVVGTGGAKDKGITCRELRWVYRFRADPKVQQYIQFWKPVGVNTFHGLKAANRGCGAEKCGPPWEDRVFTGAAKMWKSYVPKCAHDINGVHV